eukprot:2674017-Pleurochrysis_carterae.AAC.1
MAASEAAKEAVYLQRAGYLTPYFTNTGLLLERNGLSWNKFKVVSTEITDNVPIESADSNHSQQELKAAKSASCFVTSFKSAASNVSLSASTR